MHILPNSVHAPPNADTHKVALLHPPLRQPNAACDANEHFSAEDIQVHRAAAFCQIFSLLIIRRGHRRQSFQAADVNELVELRARQRTFHGAYIRTALGSLGYALTILRLFDPKFHLSTFAYAYRASGDDRTIGVTLMMMSSACFQHGGLSRLILEC